MPSKGRITYTGFILVVMTDPEYLVLVTCCVLSTVVFCVNVTRTSLFALIVWVMSSPAHQLSMYM